MGFNTNKSLNVNASEIRNKIKRSEVFNKQRLHKSKVKQELRSKRKREEKETGVIQPRSVPRTLENTRIFDETLVAPDDQEVLADEEYDEFAKIWSGEENPKIMLTTQRYPSGKIFPLIGEIMNAVPNMFYYKRGHFELKKICEYASNKSFTHLVVLTERLKKPNGMIIIRLPFGPTAAFKLRSTLLSEDIKNHGRKTSHFPEIILNNFNTRLGRRIGRVLGSLFPHNPDFTGRQVATFHNQRDFIFFRHHRYIFTDDGKDVRMQELGPRFTLKLKYLLAGTFDTRFGDYEYLYHRHNQDLNRRKFAL